MYESNTPEIIKYLTEDDLKLMYGRLNRRFVVVDALPAVSSLGPADKNVIYVVKETDGGVERYWPNVLENNVWKPVGIVQEDLNGKIDKVSAEEGHLVVADENGNLTDAGLMPGTFVALAYDPSEQIQPHATDFRKIWDALQSGIPVILLDNRESGTGLYASLNAAGYTWPDGDHMAERITDVDTDYRPHDDSIPGYYDSENGKFYYDIYHAIEIDPVDGVVYHDLVDDKVYLYVDEAFTRVLRFVQFSANELINDDPVWTLRKAARPVFFRIFEPETSATANNFYVVYGDSASSITVDLEKKADKVLNAVSGHLAALDSTGNLKDSGKKASDFATAEQGAKADKAYQKPDAGIPKSDLASDVQESLGKADTALQEHQDISGKADKSAMAITDVAGDPTKKNIKLKDGLATTVVTEHAVTGARIGDGENLPIEQGTIVIPESAIVNDGKLSIKVGNAAPVVFSANQSTNQEVNIPEAASATEQEGAHGGLMTTADKTKLDEIDLGITPGTGADLDKVNIQLKNNVSANVLTTHQDVSGKAEKSEMAISPVSGDETKKKITLKQGLEQEVVVVHQDISGKAEKSEMSVTDVSGDATKKNIKLKDGLSQDVIVAHQDVSGKAEKSEMSVTDVSGDNSKKNIKLKDGLSQDVVVAHQDISGKADKVTGATSGNFAGLDANGNLVDSGKKASDFASASAVQSVKMKDSSGSELNNGTNVIIPEASTTSPGVMSTSDKTKLDGIEAGANAYTHPSYTAQNSGMYKVTIDAQGHVSSVTAIEKSDITALGIPAQDTTYQFADDYNGTTNKGATEATVRNAVSNAIDALDKTENSTGGTNIEIKIVEENGLIKEIKVVTDNTVNATDVNTAIETALANYGGFQVVPLTSGDNPQPNVTNPSEHYIYLTKDSQSSARDPYTEWIYTQNHWEVIGETSVDLSNYIQKLSNATTGNLVKVKADGSIEDAGAKVSDFATAAQGTKADNSVQSVNINNGTEIYPDSNGKLNLPLASTTDPGAMSASDKSKLDGINNYIESATVSGRTMTLTPKSGPAVTFNDTGDINVIEKISVNGTQQTVTDKEVKLTIPAKANNAKITMKVGGAAAGDTPPEAGDFTVDQSLDKDIVIPAAVSASGNDPAKPGVMSSADKSKLDGIANGAEVNSIESITIEGDQNPLPISSENVTIPKAAYTTGADPSYTTGAVTGQDKKKLDEIEAGAQVNDIEHIKIAGESADLTIDANKRVELPLAASATTSPVAPATPGIMSATDKDKLDHIAPNADVNVIEGVKLAGESSALTPDANKVVTIPEAAVDSSGATPVYSHGLMSATDKEKLDTLKNFSKVQVSDGGATPTYTDVVPVDENSTIKFIPGRNISITGDNTAKTVTIEATGVASTVSEGKGIKVNHTQDPTTGIDDYEVTLDNALGYLGGTQSITGVTASPLNLLSTNMQIELDSQNDRFVLYEDQTDNQVYLCALKTVANQDPLLRVNGVDVFTLTYAISISRTPDPYNSFIGQASISVSRKSSTGWFGLHGNYSSYPSITGMCNITGSVDISNMGGTDITIGGKLYQAYRLAYSGDVQGSGESISIIVHMSAKEYTTGTAEYTGAQHTYTGGEGISVNVADDTINAKVGPGLQINPATNNIEVRTKQNGGIVIDPNDGMSIVLDTQAEEAIAIAEAVQSTIDERIITNMSFSEIHNAYRYGSGGTFATIGHGQFYGTLFTPVMTQEVKSNAKIGVYIRTPGNQGEIAFAIYQFDLANPGYIDLVCHTNFYWCGNLPAADGSTTSAFREFAVTYISPTCNVMSSDKLYYSVAITRDDNNAAACAIQGFYGTSGYDSQLNGIPPLTIARLNLENLTGNNIANLTSATLHTYLGRIAKADLGSEQNSTPRVFMSIRNVPQVQNV